MSQLSSFSCRTSIRTRGRTPRIPYCTKMRFSITAVAAIAAAASMPNASAFVVPSQMSGSSSNSYHRLNAVALDPVTTSAPTGGNDNNSSNNNNSEDPQQKEKTIKMDLTGVVFSGLNGKALAWDHEDFPDARDVRAIIPKDCYEPETARSLGYLSVSLIGTALCTWFGANLLSIAPPENFLTLPIWTAYSIVTGTVAMGLWVLAHECGHGAFSKNKTIQDTVGYVLHSLFLVPYYSWQRSHAVHHQYTNHLELGETHVPEKYEGEDEGSMQLRANMVKTLGEKPGVRAWGSLQAFLHLIVGWPAYLAIGATGGIDRGMTNHFWPDPLTAPNQPMKELFPGNWKAKVFKSDIGVAAAIAGAGVWALCNGLPQVMALYGGPLIVVNAWLVLYTWLQHTDTDVPHFSQDQEYNFVKGALHTIDRPYDKLDPWGLIDFLHHKIGTTHVAHHFDSTIPHYKAQAATDAIQENFPEFYLHDPTPIPQAFWRICKGCTGIEKRGDRWIWNNEGYEKLL